MKNVKVNKQSAEILAMVTASDYADVMEVATIEHLDFIIKSEAGVGMTSTRLKYINNNGLIIGVDQRGRAYYATAAIQTNNGFQVKYLTLEAYERIENAMI